ncbi:hypothetical protein JADG_002837 [Aureobasidium aubasidani]|nr:hypothetical protein JADG_002837 [Aureobasidium pullulans]
MRSCLLLSALAAVSTASIGNGILESNSTTIIDDSDWPDTTTDTNSVTRPPFIGPSHILIFPPSSISARPSSSLAKLPASRSTLSRRSDGTFDRDQDILVSISGRDLIDDPDGTDDGDHEDSLLSSASEIGTGIATKVLSAQNQLITRFNLHRVGANDVLGLAISIVTSWEYDVRSSSDRYSYQITLVFVFTNSYWSTLISSFAFPYQTDLNIPHSYSYSHKVKIIQTINHQVKLVQSVSYRVKLISQSNHDHDIDRQLYLCNDSYFVLNAHGFNLHNNHHGLPISITYRLANLVVFKTHDTWHLLHDAWSDEESHPSDLIENENRGSYYTFLYFGGFHSYDFLQNEDRGSCHNHHAFPIIFHRYLGAERLVQNQDQAEVVYWSQKDQEMFIHSQSFFKKGRTTATRWEKTRTKTKTKTPRARTKTIIRPSGVRTEYLLSTKTKMETEVLHHTRTKTRQHTRTRTKTTTATTITYIGGVQTKTVTIDIDRPSRPTKTVTVDIGRPGRSTRTLSRTGLTVVVSETPAATITIPGHSTTITRRPSTASTTVDSSTPGSQTITVSDARVRQIRGMNAGINDRKLGTFKGLGKDRKTVKFPNKHGSDACKAMSKKCKFAAKDNNTVLPCQERLAYEVFQLYEADPNQSFARGEVVACIDQNTNYCASIDWQPWIQKSPKAGKFVEDLMTQRSLNDQDEVPIASVVESMNWMLDSDARLCGETLLTVEKQRHSAGNNLGDMVGRYVLKLGTAPPKKHGPTFEDGSNDHSTDDKDGDDDDESYTPWVKPSGRHFVFPNIHDNSVVSDV